MQVLELLTGEYLVYLLIMALAALVHGTMGLGFPMVATPLLALITDVRQAVILTLIPTVIVNVASIAKGGQWGQSIRRYWPLAVYALVGSFLGSHILLLGEASYLRLVLAAMILLYLNTHRFKIGYGDWIRGHLGWSMLIFGSLAGFFAGTVNVMVPVLIIFVLELGLGAVAMVQVFNLCFLSGKLSQIIVLGSYGLLGGNYVQYIIPLCFVTLVFLGAGFTLRKKIEVSTYSKVLRLPLYLIAAILVAQFFLT